MKRQVHNLGEPKAYVMPERLRLSAEETEGLSDGEIISRLQHSWRRSPSSYTSDPVQEAIEDEQFPEAEAEAEGEIAVAGDILGVEAADRLTVHRLPYGDFAVGIEFKRESMDLLTFEVAIKVARWPGRQLRGEVIAAGICLAVAKARRERNVKHPRVIAKDVRVRPKTLFAIMKLAAQEIQRLNLQEEVLVRTFENGNL